eukprot:TRINITY_DN48689_c0_g1_i1.p1 TRINITY_DN48689_c0_g1~~TRINITY_DN48689_c0_g1_i1.p1  ORF type:complete len:613 (-),score=70.04 TRINITY_DN48689_c0_g1_i1:79-1917(-)
MDQQPSFTPSIGSGRPGGPQPPSAWRQKTAQFTPKQALDLQLQALNMSISCRCACEDSGPAFVASGDTDAGPPSPVKPVWGASNATKIGLISYLAELDQELVGPPLRVGEVWHLMPDEDSPPETENRFLRVNLSLHANGFEVSPPEGESGRTRSYGLSPFSLVQACRMHSVEADAVLSWLRIFKVSIFQHGSTHFFATHINSEMDADIQRARWVADISRTVRILTQSLFVDYAIRSDPLPGCSWTDTRLFAGYLLLCDDKGVSLVYSELHCHMDSAAIFSAYEDETCDVQVIRLSIDMNTCISERVGVDCSCFSFDGYHFAARTCSEKIFWLRAISNVKVKLRHASPNPTPEDLVQFRAAIAEYARREALDKRPVEPEDQFTRKPLLRQRNAVRRKSGGDQFVGPGWLSRQWDHVEMVDTIGSATRKGRSENSLPQADEFPQPPEKGIEGNMAMQKGPGSLALGRMGGCGGLAAADMLARAHQVPEVPPAPFKASWGGGFEIPVNGRPQGLIFPELAEAGPPIPQGMDVFFTEDSKPAPCESTESGFPLNLEESSAEQGAHELESMTSRSKISDGSRGSGAPSEATHSEAPTIETTFASAQDGRQPKRRQAN